MSFISEFVYFSWPFIAEIPLAFYVALFLETVKEWVYCAGAEVDAEVLSYTGDYLISMHWLGV